MKKTVLFTLFLSLFVPSFSFISQYANNPPSFAHYTHERTSGVAFQAGRNNAGKRLNTVALFTYDYGKNANENSTAPTDISIGSDNSSASLQMSLSYREPLSETSHLEFKSSASISRTDAERLATNPGSLRASMPELEIQIEGLFR